MDFQRLLNIKIVQLEMMRDRGYQISPEEEAIFTMTVADFHQYLTDLARKSGKNTRVNKTLLGKRYSTTDDQGKIRRAIVVYAAKTPAAKEIPITSITSFVDLITSKFPDNTGYEEAVLIVDAVVSSAGRKHLAMIKLVRHQVFNEIELVYNPTTHIDTPLHTLVPPDQVPAKLAEMKVELNKLPIIRSDDPIVKYYGWVPKSLIKIYRDDSVLNLLAPISINYRVVVG